MRSYSLEYGESQLSLQLPALVQVRGMKPAPAALDGKAAVAEALEKPIASASLAEITRQRLLEQPQGEAVIVVSDHTRPVPYRGEDGFMAPLIRTLLDNGWPAEQITVLIGAGSHRNMEADEIERMMGLKASGLAHIRVLNHEYEQPEQLRYLGQTRRKSEVYVNERYCGAALKIVTGLVESHFMAGASGGRKGICPGIVGKETLSIFHGASLLKSSQAADLILSGNPLHDEALEVAQMAGCDFLLNATIDDQKRLNGVFAGNLQQAHQAAVRFIRDYVVVELEKRYPIVLIPAGFVGVNHYQAGKAAVEAARAVEQGGWIIIVAKHSEPDPIGGHGYRASLELLRQHGKDGFMEMISAPDWQMVQEQWQVQMWCKVLEQLGDPSHLIYCNLDISAEEHDLLPGMQGLSLLPAGSWPAGGEEAIMSRMTELAVQHAREQMGDPAAEVLLLQDGPYGIPEISGS
jgi:nickel-dependent lactate racemase